MDEESVKAAFEKGEPPTASQKQLLDAVLKSVDPGDTADMYSATFKRHIQRFKNSSSVMSALKEKLVDFHTKVGGNTGMIENFLADLAPSPQKGKAMPEGMINALLRIDTGSSKCPLEDFMGCFERNLDITDTAALIEPILEKHISLGGARGK
mmetsp:Transcript_12643/g.20070  ORF Transcript_12643/g.20070 Transcript_12643/m.20070 type:complete len:153 (+) Transcript_12643:3-461(+)|eukprot:CAMPEP_0179431218 /NCGR_PEP_ID=MMETSP0799-20121207/16161_1 /TAXON_ID=46947 /ORGANISM="Geminigera cryophila, Strain CCMP2564" /LENGTH=152 /DNA_ID=CAMNT_0021208035 /DNA_START=1 /DNA_END=459 /DNA_ORIENTATION=+